MEIQKFIHLHDICPFQVYESISWDTCFWVDRDWKYWICCNDDVFPIMESDVHNHVMITLSFELEQQDSWDDGCRDTKEQWGQYTPNIGYKISAMDYILEVRPDSEIGKFILARGYDFWQVHCLLSIYNENIVFKLPPPIRGPFKALGLQYMDREKDCYSWSRLVKTSTTIY